MQITAEQRSLTGKKVKRLRKQGYVPAVISRAKKESLLIKLTEAEARKVRDLKYVEKVTIKVDEQEIQTVVSEVEINPLNNKILHISFTEITPESHVIVRTPIKLKGVSPAVKNNIGVLLTNLSYVRLVFNSENLIPYLEIDISSLKDVGDRILFTADLLPEGVKPASFNDFGQTIVTIRPPQKVRTAAEEQGEGTEEGEQAGEEAKQEPESTTENE